MIHCVLCVHTQVDRIDVHMYRRMHGRCGFVTFLWVRSSSSGWLPGRPALLVNARSTGRYSMGANGTTN